MITEEMKNLNRPGFEGQVLESLKYWAFKFCGKGDDYDALSDRISECAALLEAIRAKEI